jgi:hypothetical protein
MRRAKVAVARKLAINRAICTSATYKRLCAPAAVGAG